ncbi:unnamed protein product, partial [Oppiella nova]
MSDNLVKIPDYLPKDSNLGHGKHLVTTAKCINVLLIGRSGVGKRTFVNTLVDPQIGTSTRDTLTNTENPQISTLILKDNDTGLSYQINIIDTPGLDEKHLDNKNGADEQLMSLATECVRRNITWLNVVCMVTKAGTTEQSDVNVFKLLTEALGERYSKIAMMIVTHCDEYTETVCESFIDFIKTDKSTKPYYDYCRLGTYMFGAIDCKKVGAVPENVVRHYVAAKLERIEIMRQDIIAKIVACSDTKLDVEEFKCIYDKIHQDQNDNIKQ